MAVEIVNNAKTRRISVCNTAESLLIHKNIAEFALIAIKAKLDEKNVILYGDEIACEICPDIEKATELCTNMKKAVSEVFGHKLSANKNISEDKSKDSITAPYWCNNCGKENKPDAKFCLGCGRSFL